ncbi:MAG: NTP transferase domain-containing protein [Acidobacteria bacterium]|nr:NTP transferase domain-containing protein [Acidobacteriota bacterium]
MSYTLLVMAAGLGSRFGGDKQLAEVGPNGEAFFDYAIEDSFASGADQVVMIVRTEIEGAVREHVEKIHGADLNVAYVRQDAFGPSRPKPWGTAHAVLTASEVIDQRFLVVNADDYYGQHSYELAAKALSNMGVSDGGVIAFELGRTLPENGAVSRGVCHVDPEGGLSDITETHGIERGGDGEIRAEDPPGVLSETTPVSMNMWALGPELFTHLESQFEIFLRRHGDKEKSEFLLPEAIAELMLEEKMTVRTFKTEDDWIGVTNPGDLGPARAVLAARF